ncbi:MAG: (Fe-S)-binding protein [Chloroflexota bacterium]|nr:MAG: (Fe-S)-binding protein [Chloroflexota bacterium]
MIEAPGAESASRCARCGFCNVVCPVFRELGVESGGPRGRISLATALADGELPRSERLEQLVYDCLLCQTCISACPNGVRTDQIVMAARSRLGEDNRNHRLTDVVLRHVASTPRRLQLLALLGAAYQRSGTRSAARRLLPAHLTEKEALLPPVSVRTLQSRVPAVVPASGQRVARVGYFPGCLNNLVYTRIGRATVRALSTHGCEVVFPRSLSCCGMPQRAYGHLDVARELAARNVDAFLKAGVEVVLTDCATCGSSLSEYPELLQKRLPFRVHDVAQFLVDTLGLSSSSSTFVGKVTYHDPCHLVRGQGVRTQPRILLQRIPGLELVEMAESDVCCGGAGSFSLTRFELSMQILDRKVANILATGAQVVATGCPSCITQIAYGLKRRGSAVRVVHPVELLS